MSKEHTEKASAGSAFLYASSLLQLVRERSRTDKRNKPCLICLISVWFVTCYDTTNIYNPKIPMLHGRNVHLQGGTPFALRLNALRLPYAATVSSSLSSRGVRRGISIPAVGWCQPLLVDAATNSGCGVEHYWSMCRPIVVSSATNMRPLHGLQNDKMCLSFCWTLQRAVIARR